VELAVAVTPNLNRPAPSENMDTVDTPDQCSIEEVSGFLNINATHCLKTLLVKAADDGVIALVLRGDHELNEIKAEKLDAVASPLTFASEAEVKQVAGCEPGSLGPVGLTIPVYADHAALAVADFVCGANQDGKHLTGVNWERDLAEAIAVDIRNVQEGDPSPDGMGTLSIKRGIEVGHIFQLGRKYSEAMDATILDENGKSVIMTMGCYGIGVSRVVAATIEQNHDDKGIIWPPTVAPYEVALLPMNMHKSERLREAVDKLYDQLQLAGIDVLLDDRKERPGVMFADMELIGIPHRVVIGDRGLDNGVAEYKGRRDYESQDIALDNIVEFLQQKLN